ncbi:DUF63 family protein [Candidatus Altiarchaeota archaeon]
MFDLVSDFFVRYFVEPGYNWVNTPTYGLILGLAVFYLVVPLLKKLRVEIDEYFALSLLGFMFFGGTTRELVDQGWGIYPGYAVYPGNFWLVAPGIFLSMFALTVLVLTLSLALQHYRGIKYYWPMIVVGWTLFAYNLYLIVTHLGSLWPLLAITSFFLISALFVYALMRGFPQFSFLKFEYNYMVVAGHLLDASATFVGIDFMGFTEKHVLPTLLINTFGTAAIMFPLKLLFLLPALYIIDRDLEDDTTTRRILKLVILIIGAGPGIRDTTLAILA